MPTPTRLTTEQQRLVEANLGLADWFARRLVRRGVPVPYEEIRSLACLGLCRAAATYNGRTRFGFWAKWWMNSATKRVLLGWHSGCESLAEWDVEDDRDEPDPILAERVERLNRALDRLPQRMSGVVRARFIEGRTLAAVGAELGVTKERIRQIQNQGMERIYKDMKGD